MSSAAVVVGALRVKDFYMRAHDSVIILHCIYQVKEHFLNFFLKKDAITSKF